MLPLLGYAAYVGVGLLATAFLANASGCTSVDDQTTTEENPGGLPTIAKTIPLMAAKPDSQDMVQLPIWYGIAIEPNPDNPNATENLTVSFSLPDKLPFNFRGNVSPLYAGTIVQTQPGTDRASNEIMSNVVKLDSPAPYGSFAIETSFTAIGRNSLDIQWRGLSGVDHYVILGSDQAVPREVPVATSGSRYAVTIDHLNPASDYFFTVVGYDSDDQEIAASGTTPTLDNPAESGGMLVRTHWTNSADELPIPYADPNDPLVAANPTNVKLLANPDSSSLLASWDVVPNAYKYGVCLYNTDNIDGSPLCSETTNNAMPFSSALSPVNYQVGVTAYLDDTLDTEGTAGEINNLATWGIASLKYSINGEADIIASACSSQTDVLTTCSITLPAITGKTQIQFCNILNVLYPADAPVYSPGIDLYSSDNKSVAAITVSISGDYTSL